MKLNLLIFALLLLKLQDSFSQQTLSVRISTPEDDLEEYIPGANQTKFLDRWILVVQILNLEWKQKII